MLRKIISIRNLKSINFDAFVADMDLEEITGDHLHNMVEALKTKMSMSLRHSCTSHYQADHHSHLKSLIHRRADKQKKKVRREKI